MTLPDSQGEARRPQHGLGGQDQVAVSPRAAILLADRIQLGIGKVGGRAAADSGIVYKFSIKIRRSLLAAFAGNIPGKIPDVPAWA